jgi:nucleoside-diphosphate-sugar epimerase
VQAKRILLTGATGFIGSYFIEELVAQGHEVIAAVRPSSDLSAVKKNSLKTINLNVFDAQVLKTQLEDLAPHCVINNAGLTKAKTQEELDKVNAEYAYNLAKGWHEAEINEKHKFLHVSSLAAYGPADFQNDGLVSNKSIANPVTMYGKSKLKGEIQLKSIAGLPMVIVRPTAVYGPKERDLFMMFKSINNGLATHIGDGQSKLTFVFVSDLVKASIKLLLSDHVGKEYFITDGKSTTTKELNSIISQSLEVKSVKFGLPLPIITAVGYISEWLGRLRGKHAFLNVDKLNEIKARDWSCDIQPLINDISYEAEVDLPTGLKITADWYKENKWL